jgi:hypothetical protein
MKAIQIAFALSFGSLLLAGCGPSKQLVAAEEYEKDACACKDVKCTTEAAKKYADKVKEAGAASGSEGEAIGKHVTAATTCTTKLATANIPGMPAMPTPAH